MAAGRGRCCLRVNAADSPEHDADVAASPASAAGMVRVHEVATVTGVARLTFGHLDNSVGLGCSSDREAMVVARSTVVLASRPRDCPGRSTGPPRAGRPQRLADDAAHGRDLGFTAKLLMHPRQVQLAHAAYRPSEAEVAWDERVSAAAEQGGAVRVDGQMVNGPVVDQARSVLRRRGPE